MTRPAIDLTRRHFARTIGDIMAIGTWLWNEAEQNSEPCLVLVPAYRKTGFRPVVVAMSAAYKYTDGNYTGRVVPQFVRDLGFEDNSTNAYKVVEMILEHLPDVIEMPPDPTRTVVVGEATINLGNGQRETAQLLDYEQDR